MSRKQFKTSEATLIMRTFLTYLCALCIGCSVYGQDTTDVALAASENGDDMRSPEIPYDLEAVVNKDGEVYLRWDCDNHDRILGYKVLVSNDMDSKYEPFVKGITTESEATQYVEQGAERLTYYFKVCSMDSSLVQSEFSNIATIESYDVVPPGSPEVSSLDVLPKGLFLSWILPPDDDIEKIIISRTDNIDTQAVNFELSLNTQTSYMDEEVIRGRWYAYSLMAVDKEGNISAPSHEIKAFAEDMNPKNGAQNLAIESVPGDVLKLKVTWTVQNNTVFKYEIYKSVNGKGYELYSKVLAGGKNEFFDTKVKAKKTYGYQIRAIYSDGTLSPLSDEIIISLD